MKKLLLLSAALVLVACGEARKPADVAPAPAPAAETAPGKDYLAGAWEADKTAPILEKTLRIHLAFDQTGLTDGEIAAVAELLLAGERLHTLYLDQVHPEARAAEETLRNVRGRNDLKDIFRIMKGPIATTLDNARAAFLNVTPETPGKNMYPQDATRAGLDAFMAAHPEIRGAILNLRTVVKTATPENIDAALAALDANPALDVLHPGLRESIGSAERYFTLPYSVAWADDFMFIYDRLNAAAADIEAEDPAFGRYLRLRARDLLADDYDGGDAAWVTGDFTGNLNAQIGSYETYDDALYGVKSFFSLSLLKRNKEKSDELAAAIGDLQAIEDALPYDAKKKVRERIPVGVYDVVADFGQARGTNTASILPNEGHLSRQFGRTILIRSNILMNPEIYAEAQKSFEAATAPAQHGDLSIEGGFYRTLWHEIGHYLGPDQTSAGGDIDAALQDTADLMEEMKSDLVSLFSAQSLHDSGYYTDGQLRSVYASGILRVLQKSKPRRDQPYQIMQLIQWNWFLDKGLLRFEDGALAIDYARYPDAVTSLLKEIIALQYNGDRDAADAFVTRWTEWDNDLHGVIANKMKAAEGSRYRLVRYEALGE